MAKNLQSTLRRERVMSHQASFRGSSKKKNGVEQITVDNSVGVVAGTFDTLLPRTWGLRCNINRGGLATLIL